MGQWGSLNDIAVSSGAACTSAKPEPSYVLRGLKLPQERLFSSVRFGVGRFSAEDEIEYAVERVAASVAKLRR